MVREMVSAGLVWAAVSAWFSLWAPICREDAFPTPWAELFCPCASWHANIGVVTNQWAITDWVPSLKIAELQSLKMKMLCFEKYVSVSNESKAWSCLKARTFPFANGKNQNFHARAWRAVPFRIAWRGLSSAFVLWSPFGKRINLWRQRKATGYYVAFSFRICQISLK